MCGVGWPVISNNAMHIKRGKVSKEQLVLTHAYIQACARTHTFIHTHSHTHSHTHIHTYKTHEHTHARTHTHTHTHTHIQTHMHTHSRIPCRSRAPLEYPQS